MFAENALDFTRSGWIPFRLEYLNFRKCPLATAPTMSDQNHDFSDVHFTTSNSLPSSPLVLTRPVSPCSPMARPNFLPRLRTPLAVTQAVKGNTKDDNVSTRLITSNLICNDSGLSEAPNRSHQRQGCRQEIDTRRWPSASLPFTWPRIGQWREHFAHEPSEEASQIGYQGGEERDNGDDQKASRGMGWARGSIEGSVGCIKDNK